MNRRDAIKLSAIAALGVVASTASAACPSQKGSCATDSDDAKKNRNAMTPKDPENLTSAELKHTPLITLGEKDANGYTDVKITVGQGGVIHPSVKNHWIDFIKLHADDKFVGISKLEAEISRGAAAFSVKLDGVKTLTATAGCNVHGIWSSSLKA
jgi:superoxide reductase